MGVSLSQSRQRERTKLKNPKIQAVRDKIAYAQYQVRKFKKELLRLQMERDASYRCLDV